MKKLLVILFLFGSLVTVIVIGVVRSRRGGEPEANDRKELIVVVPQDHTYGSGPFGRQFDVSPDGKSIAFVGRPNEENRRLYLQTVADSTIREIPGTEMAAEPAFSPNGQSIAFFANGAVMKVDLAANSVSMLGKMTASPRGIAWLDGDSVIAGNVEGELLRLSSSGGTVPLTPSLGHKTPHLSPNILPGGKAILFTMSSGSLSKARIAAFILATGEEKQLLDMNAFAPRYVSTGHLVFATGFERKLMAVRFDPEKLEIVGSPKVILDLQIAGQGSGGSTDYGISSTGVLIYAQPRQDSLDNVLAQMANVNDTQIHVQPNWFTQLKLLVP